MKVVFYKARNIFYRIFRLKSVGVRALILKDEKILLVKHSYLPKWYMPGGAVDPGENGEQAARREVREEVGIDCGEFELFGFYHSKQACHDDYVALYVTKIANDDYKIDQHEIAQANWFSFDELPEDISPATKRRIEEYLGRSKKSNAW